MKDDNYAQLKEEIKQATSIDFDKVANECSKEDVLKSLEQLKAEDCEVEQRFPEVNVIENEWYQVSKEADANQWCVQGMTSWGLDKMVRDCDGTRIRKIDRIVKNAIRFDVTDAVNEAQYTPMLHIPTPPAIKAAAEKKRAEKARKEEEDRQLARALRIRSAIQEGLGVELKPKSGFWSRLCNAVRGARNIWRISK